MDIIKKLNRENAVTTIIVTHDRNVANQTKRKLEMLDGKIVKEGA